MNEIFYLCVFSIDGEPDEYHLHRNHEEALDDFKNFINDIINDMEPEYTDENERTYNDILAEEYFWDGMFSARIEKLEIY